MSEDMPTLPIKNDDPNAALLSELKLLVVRGFSELEANLKIVSDDVRVTKDRVGLTEQRITSLETRAERTSDRAKSVSRQDMGQDAAIAAIKLKVDELSERPDTGAQVLTAVQALSKTPAAKRLAAVAVPVLMLAITLVGLKLQASVAKLEAAPPPPQVTAPTDAGVTQ